MNNQLIEQITTMTNTLNHLKIKNNTEDNQEVNSIILYANAMKQILNEDKKIDMDKFHSILSEQTIRADKLIAKWT